MRNAGMFLVPTLLRRNANHPGFAIALFALCVVMAGSAGADDKVFHEDELKAAFVYNFAKFVAWSSDKTDGQLRLCISGESPFGFSALKSIDGRSVKDKQFVIKLLNNSNDLTGCHIVFVAASERNKMLQLLKTAHQQHMLTVSDMEGFAEAGGTIGLVAKGGRIRFEINLRAAKEAGVVISSRLLNLALVVYDENNRLEYDVLPK